MESEYTISRQGEPPPMLVYKVPINAVMLDQQSSVEAGEIDGNGNRMFTRHIKRTVQLMFGWGEDFVEEVWQTRDWEIVGIGTLEISYAHGEVYAIKRPYDVRTDERHIIEDHNIFESPNHLSGNEYYDMAFDLPIGYV